MTALMTEDHHETYSNKRIEGGPCEQQCQGTRAEAVCEIRQQGWPEAIKSGRADKILQEFQ